MTLQEFFASKENLAIHTPEEWMAEQLCEVFDSLGKTWCTGASYISNMEWAMKRENMCYSNDGHYGSIGFYSSEPHWTVIPFDDIEDFGKKIRYSFTATGDIVVDE